MASAIVGTAPVLFFSLLIGARVRDPAGERLAIIHDLIARLDLGPREQYPPITGLVVQIAGRDVFAPWSLVSEIDQNGIRFARVALDLGRFERRSGEVLLGHDVLDRQLVDVNGRRIVRANDIVLARSGPQLRVVGIDVSFNAIWRRAAPRTVARRASSPAIIDWADVEYLASESLEVRLRSGHPKIARLHPVEIAELVEQLPDRHGAEIVEALSDEVAADVVEELSEDHQGAVVEGLEQDRAADILEEMGPDAAADVLADLPRETAASLLAEMAPEEAADVRALLAHPEGTAGALMTTELARVPRDLTVAATLQRLRGLVEPPPFLYYVYVVDSDEASRLLGTLTLPDLVLASSETPIEQIMGVDPPRATPETSIREVAERMADYNLLALPVVDAADRLVGIVTVDDVLDDLVYDDEPTRAPNVTDAV